MVGRAYHNNAELRVMKEKIFKCDVCGYTKKQEYDFLGKLNKCPKCLIANKIHNNSWNRFIWKWLYKKL